MSINNFFLSDGQTALPKFTHGSLFSGIGGFDLAAEWIGWQNIFHCEIDEWARKLLKQNFPNANQHADIRQFDGTKYRGAVDIISGGFPCQPFSRAGRQQGKEDNRYLWPEMLRVINEVKPKFVVGENVTGIVNLALDEVCTSLEDSGYQIEIFNIPACSIGADHIRERIWVLAYSGSDTISQCLLNWDGPQIEKWYQRKKEWSENRNIVEMGTEIDRGVFIGRSFSEPKMVRISNGVSTELDEIKGFGNAIVPHVAFEIFTAIDFVLKGGKKNY